MVRYTVSVQDNIDIKESETDKTSTTEEIGGSLQWPSDNEGTSGLWLTFSRSEYSRPSRTAEAKSKAVGNVVALPMPPNFATTYGAQWDNTDFSSTERTIGRAASASFLGALNSNGGELGSLQSISEAVKAGAAAFTSNQKNILTSFGTDLVFGNENAAKIGSFVGLARNPFQAFLYRGPNFRTFEFSYKMIAKNKKESDTIRNIVKEFKLGMTPTFEEALEDNIFKYPDIYQIKATQDSHLFKIAECALTSVSVDYHGEGRAAYFEGKIPVSITLNLSFQELRIILREDIEEGF